MNIFDFAPTPKLFFGPNSLNVLPKVIEQWGERVLLITGNHSFDQPKLKNEFQQLLSSFSVTHFSSSGEPTVETVNKILQKVRPNKFDCVISIGGGSIIDLGKALSAMCTVDDEIENYLEGLPTFRPHPGTKIPFIAIPTTAGTGSEATKNAVITKYGKNGYKRSLRHSNFVPNVAIIDPLLHLSCPPQVTAASGLDALTQLIESYLSPQSNLLTDILAEKGIELAVRSLNKAYAEPEHLESRAHMAMAAYLSGLTLAHAGLGAVHGFASSIGGMYQIPHGVICGCLLVNTLQKNLNKMLVQSDNLSKTKIHRLAELILSSPPSQVIEENVHNIIYQLENLQKALKIPKLQQIGIQHNDIDKIAAVTQIKNNPVDLAIEELKEILVASW
ncbi:MAG: iron-containing alcohol dehydrogenase [Bacteroidales bacterium]|nr:iron-containing alcohol dehydrogenase [Bacteroidales bacterium]